MQRLAIIGAGAWGTALAIVARRAGRDVVLIARYPGAAAVIAATRENARRLRGVRLDDAIEVTAVPVAAADADAVLIATPAQSIRSVGRALALILDDKRPVVLCAKGIELETGLLPGEVLAEVAPRALPAVLSGPTFAVEVARGLPTAVTLACADSDVAGALVDALGSPAFRPYATEDMIGVEVGGAVKNVAAIACGIVAGRGLGENARAALMTRALAEIARLGAALGADARTLMGLAGLGDLTLSCTSAASRNYALGEAMGRGEQPATATAGALTEGAFTAPAVLTRAARAGVEMPICAAVNAVLHGDADLDTAIAELLSRPFRREGAP